MNTRKISLLAVLTAAMLVLGYAESLLPLPAALPGMKLGLANCVLVYALYMLGAREAWLLVLFKALLPALLYGSAGAVLFSLAGGALSMAGMCLLRRRFSILPVSAAGGMLHNLGQSVVAMLITRSPGLLAYAAILMAVGTICGLAVGTSASLTIKALTKAKR